ncbi:MAG: alanine--tRNA ligase [Chloroflexi bacterium]|nr:alanine--tRNA ligase [Chloroflexota bacterium]
MTSSQVRETFLKYFESQKHRIVNSSSLVPAGDPTLLFTNAGMVQFKDCFLGIDKRDYTRATTSQKCMRVSGKHNDLFTVGPSPRHHTFFEMLGNFSFGDYFKRDAITFAWTFFTEVLGLPADRLWSTVYREDDEAVELWQEIAGLPAERVGRLGKDSNFWSMGPTGPNGPCSEIMYDRGKEHCTCSLHGDCTPVTAEEEDCDRWWELWNLVFMQFNTDANGVTTPLPKPSVDTGMGMERITSVMQGVSANYDTDLFIPIMDRIQQVVGHSAATRAEHVVDYRIIADHSRATTFLIADGVLPGNEGRNYVLRLIMRRALRHAKKLGLDDPFMGRIAEAVIDVMSGHYHELQKRHDFIMEAIEREEHRFRATYNAGLNRLETVMAKLEETGQLVIPGDTIFELHDTRGFSPDLTAEIVAEHGFSVDMDGYAAAMAEQRARARAAQKVDQGEWEATYRKLDLPPTKFVGYDYDQLETTSTILALVKDGQQVVEVGEGEEVEVILAATPFYAEAGGQVTDTGWIETEYGKCYISDVQRPVEDVIVHRGQVVQGTLRQMNNAHVKVDIERRWDIMRNHTATHLLHRALRNHLGEHAEQRGSLVAPDRLRFDFVHLKAVEPEELAAIEEEVNTQILADRVVVGQVLPQQEALASGATALFGEKYGDEVRVITVGGNDTLPYYSRELCGGTHLERTGQIGLCFITSEGSVGAGLRRIEAVTGRSAESYVRSRLNTLQNVANRLAAPSEQLEERVAALQQEAQAQKKEVERLRKDLGRRQIAEALGNVQTVNDVSLVVAQVEAASADDLRDMADIARQRLGSACTVLGAALDGKPFFIVAITPDLVERGLHAGKMAKSLAAMVGGGGGGRPQMAQAGGKELDKLTEALAAAPRLVAEQLA